ncbi:MAG: 30S ribosomal protein S20 [Dehalococcoidia bacterium]|nr:30S ribosomal protein S20 [Dehalococcoidia bacterium]MQG16032.1 30S ribosomal protein S20 [SAR202 cluster bacterium]|tara:strand:- start:88314 stop:88574 length:261 start_codon:yes stop_codon:yes gene_type:complete
MPSKKSHRVSVRRNLRNAPLRTKAKNLITSARTAIESNDLDNAQELVQNAVSALDKAAKKGAVHKSNASRRKSRIMTQLAEAKKGQ